MSLQTKSNLANVNGIQLGFQEFGQGKPVIVLHGAVADADGLPPSHAVEFFGLLGGGKRDAGWDGSGKTEHRLAILPGATHYDINMQTALAAAVIPFLDGA